MFAQIIALLAYVATSVGLAIIVLMYGWGLEPVSWWWILGVGVVGRIVIDMMGSKLIKDLKG